MELAQARYALPKLAARAYAGETILLTLQGQPDAAIVPPDLAGFAKVFWTSTSSVTEKVKSPMDAPLGHGCR